MLLTSLPVTCNLLALFTASSQDSILHCPYIGLFRPSANGQIYAESTMLELQRAS